MIATAALWSITLPLDKLAVARSNALFHGFFLTLAITAAAGALLAGAREKLPLARAAAAAAASSGAPSYSAPWPSPASSSPLSLTLAGVVETIKRGIGNLLAVLFGRLVFGEPMSPGKWLAGLAHGPRRRPDPALAASLSALRIHPTEPIMRCPSCQFENPPGMKFCGNCGTKLPALCPGCGAEVVPGNKFCGECGTPVGAARAPAAATAGRGPGPRAAGAARQQHPRRPRRRPPRRPGRAKANASR